MPLPTAYSAVPDWFSWENQGVDAALADLTGSGRPDLVVLMVDDGPQQNRGLYRIGRDLDAAGVVTGGWTPWVDVPDWFSWQNQGAGIDVADVSGSGRPDLVVVAEVYAAREDPIPGVSGRQVAEAAERAGADAIFEADRPALGRRVLGLLRPGDVVLTLGAGDITRVGRELVQWLQAA